MSGWSRGWSAASRAEFGAPMRTIAHRRAGAAFRRRDRGDRPGRPRPDLVGAAPDLPAQQQHDEPHRAAAAGPVRRARSRRALFPAARRVRRDRDEPQSLRLSRPVADRRLRRHLRRGGAPARGRCDHGRPGLYRRTPRPAARHRRDPRARGPYRRDPVSVAAAAMPGLGDAVHRLAVARQAGRGAARQPGQDQRPCRCRAASRSGRSTSS